MATNNLMGGVFQTRRRMMMQQSKEKEFDGFLIRGKFTDDSTPEDWWMYWGSDTSVKVSLADCVDPITKEFEFRSEEKPTTLGNLFFGNSALECIYDIKGTEEVKSFYRTFWRCYNLKFVDMRNANLEKSNISQIFRECHALTELFINFNGTPLNDRYTFYQCYALTHVKGFINNIIGSLELNNSPLTNDSAMVFIKGLADVETPQSVFFSKPTYDTLMPEQVAIAETKNWILTYR